MSHPIRNLTRAQARRAKERRNESILNALQLIGIGLFGFAVILGSGALAFAIGANAALSMAGAQ